MPIGEDPAPVTPKLGPHGHWCTFADLPCHTIPYTTPKEHRQASYRITVTASTHTGGGAPALWDSGDVASGNCLEIGYGGFGYVMALKAMAEMAAAIGNTTQAARHAGLAGLTTQAFHAAFWNPHLEVYGGDSGARQTLPCQRW